MASSAGNTLIYEGCNFFRQRLILGILSGRSVKIKKIRHTDDSPGLRDFEANFLRLLEKVTNGTTIVVNETGTAVFFQPGMLIGGTFDHDCNPQRSIGYYLEGLLCLSPFMKRPVKCVLRGVTNSKTDPSVDLLKLSALPVLKRFLGTDDGLELKITSRGAAPEGGGEVHFSCPCKHKLRPVQFTDQGKIKRIRGVAWAVRVSPATCNRLVDNARSILNKFLPDIYIYTDHLRGGHSGKSPGFGLTLVAETTTGVFLCAESCSNPKGSSDGPTVPDDLGKYTAQLLLEEIYKGGCVDSNNQSLACVFMALGDKDVSTVKVGPLSPYTIHFLRHLKDFFQVIFKIDVEKQSETESEEVQTLKTGGDKVLLTCVGAGYRNLSKVIL